MEDIIHLLPDSVANQIAAGEVVQRPSSVIKELVENSIDAGAKHIQIIIKDAGRTLIQVIDDGKGMSETDARLAFERHATSKISQATDLFTLQTMGFRGEALASIAAVAQVELRTRRAEDELGTRIEIAGNRVEVQEPVSCPQGSNFSVKNLFFNIPARRKFLKSNTTEFRKIEEDFLRIALVYQDVEFEMWHNDQLCHKLPVSSLRERIVNVFGRSINQNLVTVKVESGIVKINGYVGKPESAKKKNDKQFFFVNGRYMRHPYFHKAVVNAFERMLQPDTSPDYFLYLEVDPSTIDVNIHPTKTEIKFENEQAIWPIISAAVKESLGRFNITSSIDFDTDGRPDFESLSIGGGNLVFSSPDAPIDPSYNPFKTSGGSSAGGSYSRKPSVKNWENLYSDFENERPAEPSFDFEETTLSAGFTSKNSFGSDTFEDVVHSQSEIELEGMTQRNASQFFQFKNKFIFTTVSSGLMCIDQHRASVRILYDKFLLCVENKKSVTQRLIFPEVIDLRASEAVVLDDIMDELTGFGFEISNLGQGSYSVNGIPADNPDLNATDFLAKMIDTVKEENIRICEDMQQRMALSLAQASAIQYGRKLHEDEIVSLVNELFTLPGHSETPDGKPIISIISNDEIEKRFK